MFQTINVLQRLRSEQQIFSQSVLFIPEYFPVRVGGKQCPSGRQGLSEPVNAPAEHAGRRGRSLATGLTPRGTGRKWH